MTRIPKEWRDIHDALLEAGWTYDGVRRGHHRYKAPEGHRGRAIFTMGSSPSDYRGKLNAISKLRKEGINVVRRTR